MKIDHDLQAQNGVLFIVSAEDMHEESYDVLCIFLVMIVQGQPM